MRSLVRCARDRHRDGPRRRSDVRRRIRRPRHAAPGCLGRPRLDHRDDPALELLRRLRPRLPGRLPRSSTRTSRSSPPSMGSNEEAIAKIQAGFDADVVNSCVDEATLEMVQKGIYAPLNRSRLEHWDDLFPSMQKLPGVQVDGQIYMRAGRRGHLGHRVQRRRRHDAAGLVDRPVRPAVGRAGRHGGHRGHRVHDRRAHERHPGSDQHGSSADRSGQAVPDRSQVASSARSGRATPRSSRCSSPARS